VRNQSEIQRINQQLQQQSTKKKSTLDLRPLKFEQEEKKNMKEFVLLGHSGPVYGLNLSVDDKLLLSCSFDTTSKVSF